MPREMRHQPTSPAMILGNYYCTIHQHEALSFLLHSPLNDLLSIARAVGDRTSLALVAWGEQVTIAAPLALANTSLEIERTNCIHFHTKRIIYRHVRCRAHPLAHFAHSATRHARELQAGLGVAAAMFWDASRIFNPQNSWPARSHTSSSFKTLGITNKINNKLPTKTLRSKKPKLQVVYGCGLNIGVLRL